jgi:hypothetical protein
MRNIGIFGIIAFAGITLAARCQDDPVVRVDFTSLTRGYQKEVAISKDSVVEIISGLAEYRVTKSRQTDDEWKELVATLRGISLDEIPSLTSPTSKRAYDGARHSTIMISTRGGKSYTHGFDDEDPHEKLQPLMKAITKSAGGKQ